MASSFFETRPIDLPRELRQSDAGPSREAAPALSATTDWRFLRFLFLPLGLYALVAKCRMLFDATEQTGVLSVLDGWRSDPALYLFLFACSGMLLSLTRGRRARRLVAALAIFAGCLASAFTTASLYFYQVSGSQIDWVLSHAFLIRMSEMLNVLSSESDPMVFAHLVIPALAAVLALRARPWQSVPLARSARFGHAAFYGSIAIVAGILTATPSLTLERRDLFLNAPLKVAASAIASLGEPKLDAEYDPAALAAARLEPTSKRPWRNVVILMLESTRATATSPYAASIQTTPFMTELARESLLLENAYAVLPHTSKATVSVLCGIEPHLRLAATESRPGAIAARCLPELLRDHGYSTLYMMPDTKHFADWDQLVENTGHEEFIALEDMGDTSDFEWAHYFGKEDDVSLAPMREWLEENRDDPFLLSYLTATPHHDYQAPKRYGRHDYAEEDEYNRYLNAVHYQDNFLKNVFALFKELDLYEETLFVLVGDHGQAFMEHGRFGHSNVPYEEGITVPFLIHAPGAFEDG
ncbi:MAG: LTA synthase family protein, partial [Myxococcota bacterium]